MLIRKLFNFNKYHQINFDDFINTEEITEKKIQIYLDTFQIPKFTYPHLHGSNDNYQKFIILGNMRTGSTYLANLLMSHSQVVCFHELFQKSATFFYPGYPLPNDAKLIHLRDHFPVDFLKIFVYKTYLENIKAVGFKLFYHQAQDKNLKQVWKYLQGTKGLKIIHLLRENLLENYASLQISLKTDIWATFNLETVKKIRQNMLSPIMPGNTFSGSFSTPKITIEFNDCLNYFKDVSMKSDEVNSFFRNTPMHKIYYEKLIQNPDKEIESLSAFLNIPSEKLTSSVIKQNRKQMSEIIVNYKELKECFKNSPWYKYFQE